MRTLTAPSLLAAIHVAPLSARRPTRFRRNELKNLARRKGYGVARIYQAHIGWTYRINLLTFPGCTQRVVKDYDYCKTSYATAAERAALHLLTKPDVSGVRKKK